MSEFARTRAMRQFYRDVFTRMIDLPVVDALPAPIVAEIFNFKSSELKRLEPMIAVASTGQDVEKEAALKNMLRAITLANRAFEANGKGEPQSLSEDLCTEITEYIVAALKVDNNTDYIVAAIQILFRINEISSALFLINNNLSLVSNSGTVLKILLLICLMEEDYNQAMVVIQALTSDSRLIGEDPLALLMITCGIYKLGGLPDSFIDFRTLDDDTHSSTELPEYKWHIVKDSTENTTVLVACDKGDYFSHALPLVYSLYETNRGVLDVHFHLYNADDELKQNIYALRRQLPDLHISATLEHVPGGSNMALQYAVRRTLFLRYALRKFGTPIVAMNADLLARQAWLSPNVPLMVLENEASPFWDTIFTGLIYAEPNILTQRYFDTVGRFIESNLQTDTQHWNMESVALAASLDRLSNTDQLAVSRIPRGTMLGRSNQHDVFCWLLAAKAGPQDPSQHYRASLIKKYQR